MAEPQLGVCPHDEDSKLSMTSNITGIMTFCVAIIIGTWLKLHTWNNAEREFEDFVEYIQLHKTELSWMRGLVKDTALDGVTKNAMRPLPQGYIRSGRPISPTLERPNQRDRSRERLRTAPIRSLNLQDKWRKTAYAAVKRARNDRAVIEAVQQEIRCSRMKKKRERREENAERDRNIFGTIFTIIEQMDTKLLKIVDDVKRKRPEDAYDNMLMYREGQQGYLPTERLRTEPLRALTAENGDLRTDGTEASKRVNSAPQFSRARMLSGNRLIPASVMRTDSLPEGQTYQAQNFVLQPIHAVLNRRLAPSLQPEQPGNGVLPTTEIRGPQDSATANGSSCSITASAPQSQAANGYGTPHQGANFVDPTPARHGTLMELRLKRSLSSRIAHVIQSAFPSWWFSRYYIAWNWLRKREEALKLRAERDMQWSRVHASQLALLTRRIEDQDEQLDLLDFHITLHNRLIQRASWTRSRR